MSPNLPDEDNSNATKSKVKQQQSSPSANKDNKQYGLSTKLALTRLHDDIEKLLLDYERKFKEQSFGSKLRSAFQLRFESAQGWFTICTTLLTIIALLIANAYVAAIALTFIFALDIFIVLREHILRNTEIYRKTRRIMAEIHLAAQELCSEWQPQNYPHLCSPVSPCVSLQWTYRDGILVNLPWALLVRGDHIVLRPGHITPARCAEVDGKKFLNAHEIYGVAQIGDPPVKPVARAPLPDMICCLESTPYLDNLRIILENATKRPSTIYNQQRYLLVSKYIQQWGFICTLLITLCAGLLRYNGMGVPPQDETEDDDVQFYWKHVLLESAAAAVIPLLPLIFPIMWISMNLWGVARLQVFLKTPQLLIAKESEKSFEEDLDTPTYDYGNIPLVRAQVLRNWLQLWRGESELLPRTANVVQVLGSITALCCVDKKGILSWPNPTAEKVFFLHEMDEEKQDKHSNSTSTLNTESEEPDLQENKKSGIVAEVLDLTHDQHCPFQLEFDDHDWKLHIKSLKPLGLAILLNTCSPLTHAHYTQFCGHVTAVAMLDKDLVPVVNRYAIVETSMNSFLHGRCLCELAKKIGFTDHATDRFTLEGQLASYRHLQPDVIRRDIRFARQLQMSSKVKVPFPHSLSVAMRENPGGYLSLFTQGTADIILEYCDDFWDGKDLRPLSQQDRKRALDFYQRSALTAYCTAFSYRPLRHGINSALNAAGQLRGAPIAYLELPPESKVRLPHIDKLHSDFECSAPAVLSHSISTDSLLFSDSKDEDVSDVEGCFEMQCHQVFIGMVTMQYQAQTDIVQLVERLDRACIRFVHFSKENELRSRVFSEKMGLESGWNCHISLLSEADDQATTSAGAAAAADASNLHLNLLPHTTNLESSKNLSSSAPGAISNHDYNMLQASGETASNASLAGSRASLSNSNSRQQRQSQDSVMDDNCRSLSILTESTEQSAPVQFDLSNRAKLPRGIENIRPHLEKVDNVPLQVSLFTDCSAEATRQMLDIMQSYGEIVVCFGSSASNSNAEIFLQADCSVAVEPLYPQVCQDIQSYTESNILNNKLRLLRLKKSCIDATGDYKNESQLTEELLECGLYGEGAARPMATQGNTVSPIYLSRLLNSLPCSISVLRDDPLSLVAIIELSRRFSAGLWNCIQFWACCAGTLAAINILSACLSLQPLLTPLMVIYLMCVPVPLIALALAHIDVDPKIMNRATGKKQTDYDTRAFGFVLWCYGFKFLAPILILTLAYCAFMAHPLELIDVDENNRFLNLRMSRCYSFLGILMHFVFISTSFVHRDHSLWQKNPFRNRIWFFTCLLLLLLHIGFCGMQVLLQQELQEQLDEVWPMLAFVYLGSLLSLMAAEIAKWQEIKVNTRYQRRARLDFGTKLGMNSPF